MFDRENEVKNSKTRRSSAPSIDYIAKNIYFKYNFYFPAAKHLLL